MNVPRDPANSQNWDTTDLVIPGHKKISVFIPEELVKDAKHIQIFLDAMVYKLRKNAHKDGFDEVDIQRCFELMMEEIDELKAAIKEGNRIEILTEAADIANFSLLAATAALAGRK